MLSPKQQVSLTETLQLLLNLSLNNFLHTLPTSVTANIRDTALTLLNTNELLRQDLGEIITILRAQSKVNSASKLGWVGGGKRDMGRTGVTGDRAAGSSNTNGGVGVQDVTTGHRALGAASSETLGEGGGVDIADSSDGLVVADTFALEVDLGAFEDGAGNLEATLGLEVVQPATDAVASVLAALFGGVAGGGLVGEEPEETLEVAADQDVHGGAVGFLDAMVCGGIESLLCVVTAAAEETVEDIILVGGDDELVGGKTHLLSEPASEDITEVTGGNDYADLGVFFVGGRLDQREVGVEVVGHLGEDTAPVDAVDSGDVVSGVEVLVGEEGLDDVLAVIEGALHSEVVHVGVEDGGHLGLLDLGDLAVGV